MPANYVLLEKITVGAAGASSVTFSGIPQTGYTDLVVKLSMRTSAGSAGFTTSFNGVTTNLSSRRLEATPAGSSTSGTTIFSYGINYSGTTASTFGNSEVYIPNYTSSNFKSVSIDGANEDNSATAYMSLVAGLWSNTAAITSITFTPQSGNFAANSTFYLYGVAKLGTTPAIVPYATGGNTIMTDGTYWYHAFKSSGTFTPAKGLSCDVLVIGGGGGQGNYGGGGAGGVFYATAQSLASGTGYTATIGAGGTGDPTAGTNSTFASLTAGVGGGVAGYTGAPTGGNGGSGGGGSLNTAGGTSTQTSTGGTGYGFAGGAGNASYGGGGGGAGAVGTGGSGSGNGGIGTSAFSSWGLATGTGENVAGTVYFAGGGAGGNGSGSRGTGGSGGGGSGTREAIANTGGGGGGGTGNAGSGIVIVRYAV